MDELWGAQVHVRDLSLWLVSKGHTPVILSGVLGIVSDELTKKGLDCRLIPAMGRSINPLKDFMAVFQTIKVLKELKPDLVTCHSSKAGIIGRVAARILGIPCIFTAHNWTFGFGVSWYLRAFYWVYEWIGARLGTHIITVSAHGRAQALKAFLASPQKITAINNGMPDMDSRLLEQKSSGAETQLMMIARIGWPKDHLCLFEALALCRDLQWRLTLVGAGDATNLKEKAKIIGIDERLSWLGQREDITNLLHEKCDIFILSSKWEGFPLSILEAMRAGLPVIASDVGGIREAVENDKNGFVVQPGNPLKLSMKIRTLLEDIPMRKRMGIIGRELFIKNFTFEEMAQKTLSVYEKVLAKI